MTSLSGLQHQLATIRSKVGETPENFLLSEDWQEWKVFFLQASIPFPEAHEALQAAIVRLESEPISMHPRPGIWKGFIPGTKEYTEHAMVKAIDQYMDARVYIAEQLVAIQDTYKTSQK